MDETQVDSLKTICTRYIAKNIRATLLTKNKKLRRGIILSAEFSENILASVDNNAFVARNVMAVFKNKARTRLRFLRLRNCEELTDDVFEVLMSHYPISIDIHNCPKLTTQSLNIINKYGRHLKEILIGNSVQILPANFQSFLGPGTSSHNILETPNVCKLVIWGLNVFPDEDREGQDYWNKLTGEFIQNLQYLDMSDCEGIENFSFLKNAKNLKSLLLYNVNLKWTTNWSILKELTELRHLDIGQSLRNTRPYIEADSLLSSLVEKLSNLSSLDISGTNLDGLAIEGLTNQPNQDNWSDIPGLKSRVNTPLEFLGLYRTHHEASHRNRIPAKTITGNNDESQLLRAFQAYMDRPGVLEYMFSDLHTLCRTEEATEIYRWINLVLQAMNRHVREYVVQVNGSASLSYFVKNRVDMISFKLKREIIITIMNAMDTHKNSEIMRYGFLTIFCFKIQDMMFDYEKLVRLTIENLFSSFGMQANVVQITMASICFLCKVEGSPKRLGELGTIQKILQLIEDKLNRQDGGEDIEDAWTTMLAIIDTTPENCERFLEGGGMELFLRCRRFPNQLEFLKKMMSLWRNVVSVPHLRPQLMISDFIAVFYNLLDSFQGRERMQVSYNASFVLIHLLSDGVEKWTVPIPTRQQTINKLTRNIRRWNINSFPIISYNSLRTVLEMLKVDHTKECQLWAAWTMATLTKVDPEKYIPLLEEEINVLEHLLSVEDASDLGRYARLAFDQVKAFIEIQVQSFFEARTKFPKIIVILYCAMQMATFYRNSNHPTKR